MVFVSMAELRDRFEALLQVESTVYCVFDNYLTEYVDHGLSSSRNAAWRTEYIRCGQSGQVPRDSCPSSLTVLLLLTHYAHSSDGRSPS
mmetsp:Transcript_31484/g.71237  ORF Transcript_31484/g.71237 Transcript_31484/m.71237 type:complete len:89 (-) Transcript_31484:81-347(-)